MSDIDIKSGVLTRKVIRRGIHPVLCPPSQPFPSQSQIRWKASSVYFLICLISVTRTIPTSSSCSCYKWNSRGCPRHCSTFSELLDLNGLAFLWAGGNLTRGDKLFTLRRPLVNSIKYQKVETEQRDFWCLPTLTLCHLNPLAMHFSYSFPVRILSPFIKESKWKWPYILNMSYPHKSYWIKEEQLVLWFHSAYVWMSE